MIIKSTETEVGNKNVSALDAHKAVVKDAHENHLTRKLKHLYVDNKLDLSTQQIEEIESHIKTCEKCRYDIDLRSKYRNQ